MNSMLKMNLPMTIKKKDPKVLETTYPIDISYANEGALLQDIIQ
jgi:hypothetical protein